MIVSGPNQSIEIKRFRAIEQAEIKTKTPPDFGLNALTGEVDSTRN